MSAPDKIYVREYPDGVARFWEEKKKDDVVATIPHEYIRKDYLLEKIRKTAIWNTIRVGKQEIRDIVTKIIESI